MILEQWYTWQPLKKMTGEYYIKSYINNNFCSLTIILEQYDIQDKTAVHIHIDDIEAYRVTNETYKLKMWEYLSNTHMDLNRKWPLFIIEKSTFLQFLSDESKGISDYIRLKHYCVMDSEWSIDVATHTKPVVEIVIDGKVVESSNPDIRASISSEKTKQGT